MMIPFDQVIETIKKQMKPANLVQHLAAMLEELIAYMPPEVTVADLVMGWRLLAQSASPNEAPAIAHRRKVYVDLTVAVAPLTDDNGNLETTVKIWQAWAAGLQTSDVPRNTAMVKTLARELDELRACS